MLDDGAVVVRVRRGSKSITMYQLSESVFALLAVRASAATQGSSL